MGITPLFLVCVCVNGCNATFSRLCVCLWVQRHFFTFVCVFMGATPLFLVCVCVSQTRQSGVAPINTHTNVKKLRCTHKHTHTRKKVALHPLTHTQKWKSGVTSINTHTKVKKWRCTDKHTHKREKVVLHPWSMGATPLFHVCVCVYRCNATFSLLCVC
jgi:hypothetical protein